jgi:AcrR family transcriptional regulator
MAGRGFHGMSVGKLGAGVTGPALYWHFPSKQALLVALLIDISERRFAGGAACVADTDGPADASGSYGGTSTSRRAGPTCSAYRTATS